MTCKPRQISGNDPLAAISKDYNRYCDRIVGNATDILDRAFIIDLLEAANSRGTIRTVLGFGPTDVIADGNPMPLWVELVAINMRTQADWVIVDDVHAFGRAPEGKEADWTGIGIAPILDAIDRSRIVDAEVIGDQLVIWRSAS